MNGRIDAEDTPWGRLAAVARSLCLRTDDQFQATHRGPKAPDYADFKDLLEPFVKRELLRARIDEARRISATSLTERMRQLDKEMLDLEFPKGYQI